MLRCFHVLSIIPSVLYFYRCGFLDGFVSIYTNETLRCVFISADNGRLCRPYIIVERQQPKVKQRHLDRLIAGKMDFDAFLRKGLVEYLDVNEENDSHIALYIGDISK
jgi:DNA-directed RNA polymerase III subunit RPC2